MSGLKKFLRHPKVDCQFPLQFAIHDDDNFQYQFHCQHGMHSSVRLPYATHAPTFSDYSANPLVPQAENPLPKGLFDEKGAFMRPQAVFRDFVSSGPGAKFAPESGRYHLYVSYACPWGVCPNSLSLPFPPPLSPTWHHHLTLAFWNFSCSFSGVLNVGTEG